MKPKSLFVECRHLAALLKKMRGNDVYSEKEIIQKLLRTVIHHDLQPDQHYRGAISLKKNGELKGKRVLLQVDTVLPLALSSDGEFPNDVAVQYLMPVPVESVR